MATYLKINQGGSVIFIPGMRREVRSPVIIDITNINVKTAESALREIGIKDYEIYDKVGSRKKIRTPKPVEEVPVFDNKIIKIEDEEIAEDSGILKKLNSIETLLEDLVKQNKERPIYYEPEAIRIAKKEKEKSESFIPEIRIDTLSGKTEAKKSDESVSSDFMDIAKLLKDLNKKEN